MPKAEQLGLYSAHLTAVQDERVYYQAMVNDSRQTFAKYDIPSNGSFPETAEDSVALHSFDFAQSVFIPHYPDQAGPIYFKVPLRTHIIGIVSKFAMKKTFYLFDERNTIEENNEESHGPNAVISFLYHHLITRGRNE